MRLLVIAESPPTLDPRLANGSTMITAHVIPLLSPDIEIDLLYFDDRPCGPSDAVLDRVDSVRVLPLRAGWRGWAAQAYTRLPRATALRTLPVDEVRSAAQDVDAVYLHGLHTAPLGPLASAPATINVIDPWSQFWRERARGKKPHHAAYLLDQANRADRLERRIATWATTVVVVNPADAVSLGQRTGGHVVAVPNGVSADVHDVVRPDPDVVCFIGTLDYDPNVEALERLIHRIWPVVIARRPTARLRIIGRRPGEWLRELHAPGIELVGPVDDVAAEFAASAVAAYVGITGRGTKNTVSEALAAGCPVVASPEAARGQSPDEHLTICADDAALADAILARLTVDAPRPRGAAPRSWAQAAHEYETLLRAGTS